MDTPTARPTFPDIVNRLYAFVAIDRIKVRTNTKFEVRSFARS